jgi:hypothetical protein
MQISHGGLPPASPIAPWAAPTMTRVTVFAILFFGISACDNAAGTPTPWKDACVHSSGAPACGESQRLVVTPSGSSAADAGIAELGASQDQEDDPVESDPFGVAPSRSTGGDAFSIRLTASLRPSILAQPSHGRTNPLRC